MNFGFLLFNDAEELDIVGPWEMITMWSQHFGGPENCFCISQTKNIITCAKGLRLVPDYDFNDCPTLYYLLIPGGVGTQEEVKNKTLLDFVKTRASNCEKVFSACTGTFILQAANLLTGKKATTYWDRLDLLRQLPDISVEESRYVRNEHIWTAAGVSAGIDMSLAFIAEEAGKAIASKVQLYTEYYPSNKKYGQEHTQSYAPAYAKL